MSTDTQAPEISETDVEAINEGFTDTMIELLRDCGRLLMDAKLSEVRIVEYNAEYGCVHLEGHGAAVIRLVQRAELHGMKYEWYSKPDHPDDKGSFYLYPMRKEPT